MSVVVVVADNDDVFDWEARLGHNKASIEANFGCDEKELLLGERIRRDRSGSYELCIVITW